MQTSNEDSIVEIVERVRYVEFLRGVPVELPSETKELLRSGIRKALTEKDKQREEAVAEAKREELDRIKTVLITEYYLKSKELIPHDESKKNHGTCCYCGTCGHDNDYCVCGHNELLQALTPPTN